jgi:tRNA/tmRNA/rRNA uracil-C5-methylase (TrmA/RlmC/RlmD family)
MKFSEIIHQRLRIRGLINNPAEPLAHMAYKEELVLKDRALAEFWHGAALAGKPELVKASPRSRHYRTTTKRVAQFTNKVCRLGFVGDDGRRFREPIAESSLEPVEHAAIYGFVLERLNRPSFAPLSQHLNYVIIRGSYTEFTVIFNVSRVDATIVRRLKHLSEDLQKAPLGAVSAFAFVDPTRSNYYLDSGDAEGSFKVKNLFGHELLFAAFEGNRYLYHPTVFSQVNESMVPAMVKTAAALLGPAPRARLLDLYCGYGLFSYALAPLFKQVVGFEAAPLSIESAEASRRFHAEAAVRFRLCRIAAGTLRTALPRDEKTDEVCLLDPPRQGTGHGVIDVVAGRNPARVLHLCCSVDEIPRQMAEWRDAGYALSRVVPLDMFPGTPNLEVLILLEPGKRS